MESWKEQPRRNEEVCDELWPQGGRALVEQTDTHNLPRIGTHWQLLLFNIAMEIAYRVLKYGITKGLNRFPTCGMCHRYDFLVCLLERT